MADHTELVSEMTLLDQMGTQERQKLARKRRSQQIKKWSQREKEWLAKERQLNKKLASSLNEDSHGLNLKNYTTYNSNHRNNINGAQTIQPDGRVHFDNSVMLLEAAARNDIDEVRRLLRLGVSPDSTNHDGLTALHQCCVDAFEPMMKLLIEFGADVNAKDSEQWTPLHAACTCNHPNIVKYLVNSGADLLAVNGDGNMPFDICEDEATLDHIESEMVKRNITQEIIDYTRASTEIKMLKDLQVHVAEGADVNAKDTDGVTPLHIAAANGYTSVVKFLLDNGADVDPRDSDHWTPLHGAACWAHLQHTKVIELLVQAGADMNAKTLNGESPLEICDNPEIREHLVQLKDEIETKHASTANNLRRTQSRTNSRTHSVRRTSIREKAQISRREAREEALLRQETNPSQNNSDEDSHAMGDYNNKSNGRFQFQPNDKNVSVMNGAKKDKSKIDDNLGDKNQIFASSELPVNKISKDENSNNKDSPYKLSHVNDVLIENSADVQTDFSYSSKIANIDRVNGNSELNSLTNNNAHQTTIQIKSDDSSQSNSNGPINRIVDESYAASSHICAGEVIDTNIQDGCSPPNTDTKSENLEEARHNMNLIDTKAIDNLSASINQYLDQNAQNHSHQTQSLTNQISPQSSLVFASINCTLSDLKKQRSDLRHRSMNMPISLPSNTNEQKETKSDLKNTNQRPLDLPDSANPSTVSSFNGFSDVDSNQVELKNQESLVGLTPHTLNNKPITSDLLVNEKPFGLNLDVCKNYMDHKSYIETSTTSPTNDSGKMKFISQPNGPAKRDLPPPSPSQALRKFKGDPSEVVGGKERYKTRRCCILI